MTALLAKGVHFKGWELAILYAPCMLFFSVALFFGVRWALWRIGWLRSPRSVETKP